jgi:RNA polymerase sigma-70 factor, ECF subfamily
MIDHIEDTCVPTEFELIALARQGDREAFGELIQRHYHSCVNVAAVVLSDRTEAQDETQNACWKAFTHIGQYRGTAAFSSWLIKIVVNECFMRLRVRRRTQLIHFDAAIGSTGSVPMELVGSADDPEHGLVKRQLFAIVENEIRLIPPLLRDVILLRDFQDLSMGDVADQLGITVPAAKSRARLALRERVLQRYGRNGCRMTASRVQMLPARSARRANGM